MISDWRRTLAKCASCFLFAGLFLDGITTFHQTIKMNCINLGNGITHARIRVLLAGHILLAIFITAGKRQECNMTRAFNRAGEFTLVFCTCAGLAAWSDLALICDESPQNIHKLIIDMHVSICAELANLRS
jgi:hypothetical protein